jgi:hypothetical protein
MVGERAILAEDSISTRFSNSHALRNGFCADLGKSTADHRDIREAFPKTLPCGLGDVQSVLSITISSQRTKKLVPTDSPRVAGVSFPAWVGLILILISR